MCLVIIQYYMLQCAQICSMQPNGLNLYRTVFGIKYYSYFDIIYLIDTGRAVKMKSKKCPTKLDHISFWSDVHSGQF
jgi:hypothetical protein